LLLIKLCEANLMIEGGLRSGEVRMGQGLGRRQYSGS